MITFDMHQWADYAYHAESDDENAVLFLANEGLHQGNDVDVLIKVKQLLTFKTIADFFKKNDRFA